jgi:hypothetical protein
MDWIIVEFSFKQEQGLFSLSPSCPTQWKCQPDCSPQSSSRVKNVWSFTSAVLYFAGVGFVRLMMHVKTGWCSPHFNDLVVILVYLYFSVV